MTYIYTLLPSIPVKVSSYDETAMADLGSVCKFTVRCRVSSTSLVVAAVTCKAFYDERKRPKKTLID